MQPANVVRMMPHALFKAPERPKRRGRLPPGVVSIKRAARLRVGVLAEIVVSRNAENIGTRVVIKGYDADSQFCWLVKSLGAPIRCNDGALDTEAYFRDKSLRRVWTGLSANTRLKLRMLRGAS